MKLKPLLAVLAMLIGVNAHAAGDAAAGQGKAAVCAACHGVDGNSVDPQYPKIAGQHAEVTAQQLALFKSGKRDNAIMLGFSVTLSEQDMADLGAYFATQTMSTGLASDAPISGGPYDGQPMHKVGESIYRGGIVEPERHVPACMACHGVAGAGNPGARYPRVGGQHARYTADMLKRFRGGAVYGEVSDPHALIMSQIAARLTDTEIDALATYMEGLHAAP